MLMKWAVNTRLFWVVAVLTKSPIPGAIITYVTVWHNYRIKLFKHITKDGRYCRNINDTIPFRIIRSFVPKHLLLINLIE